MNAAQSAVGAARSGLGAVQSALGAATDSRRGDDGSGSSGSSSGSSGQLLQGVKNYPYISTNDASYPPELVQLLSQQATWEIMSSEPLVRELVGRAVAAAGGSGSG